MLKNKGLVWGRGAAARAVRRDVYETMWAAWWRDGAARRPARSALVRRSESPSSATLLAVPDAENFNVLPYDTVANDVGDPFGSE